jgi:hypothetical protein
MCEKGALWGDWGSADRGSDLMSREMVCKIILVMGELG